MAERSAEDLRRRAAIVEPVSDDRAPADFFNRPLAEVDPEIAEVLALELERQQRTLEMIASENFVPSRCSSARARC